MSQGINKCIFIGNLGKDPEIRYTQNGKAVTSFSIGCGYSVKDGEQWVDKVEWVPVVIWGKDAEFVCKYSGKGKQIYVEGRFQTRKYQDKEGKDRYASEIVAESIRLLGGRGQGDGDGGRGGSQQSGGGQRSEGGSRSGGQRQQQAPADSHDNYIPDAADDSIPF